MAPKAARGAGAGKRAREVVPAAAPPASKRKCADVDVNLANVLEALANAGLPDDCTAMLTALAPPCLGFPAAERQEPHVIMVMKMIAETISVRQKALKQAVDDAENKLAHIEASKAQREVKVSEASNLVAERTASSEDAATTLQAASQRIVAAQSDLDEAQKHSVALEAAIAEALAEKQSVERGMTDHFMPLKEGGFDAEQAKAHVQVLLPLSLKIKVDESLATALPSTCAKQPSERAPFDQMVVDQFEEQMRKKVAELEEVIIKNQQSKSENLAVVQAAQVAFDDAKEKQTQAASHLQAVTALQNEAHRAYAEAKAAVAHFEPDVQQANENIKVHKIALDKFASQTMPSWESFLEKPSAAVSGETVLSADVLPSVVDQN